jgi:sulfide dehydrogenase cytochrome subunit
MQFRTCPFSSLFLSGFIVLSLGCAVVVSPGPAEHRIGSTAERPVGSEDAATLPGPRQPTVSLERCNKCHMPGAEKNEPWIPLIYGQPVDYVKRMLLQFRVGYRPGKQMYEVTQDYSEAELSQLATLVAAHKRVRLSQALDAAKIRRGKAIYEKRCSACHLAEGRASDFDAAILAGQPLEYLQRQLSNIRTTRRKALYMMVEVYEGLSNDDLDALAHFFASRD